MSVNVGDRSQSHYHILESTRILREYTDTICKEKYFGSDPDYLASLLRLTAMEIEITTLEFYGTPIYNIECFIERRQLQSKVRGLCYRLEKLLEIAKQRKYSCMTSNRNNYWIGLLNDVLNNLQETIEYENTKYEHLINKARD